MTGLHSAMKLHEMTTANIREALRNRGLPITGGKADLELRLRNDLETKGEDPDDLELRGRKGGGRSGECFISTNDEPN